MVLASDVQLNLASSSLIGGDNIAKAILCCFDATERFIEMKPFPIDDEEATHKSDGYNIQKSTIINEVLQNIYQ